MNNQNKVYCIFSVKYLVSRVKTFIFAAENKK